MLQEAEEYKLNQITYRTCDLGQGLNFLCLSSITFKIEIIRTSLLWSKLFDYGKH